MRGAHLPMCFDYKILTKNVSLIFIHSVPKVNSHTLLSHIHDYKSLKNRIPPLTPHTCFKTNLRTKMFGNNEFIKNIDSTQSLR